jgi:hypothetical protein
VVSHWPLAEGIQFRNLVTVFEICGGIRDTATIFSLSTQTIYRQYCSTCYLYIYLLIVFILFLPKGSEKSTGNLRRQRYFVNREAISFKLFILSWKVKKKTCKNLIKYAAKKYSAFGKLLCTYKRYWKWCPRASVQSWTEPYRSLSEHRLPELTVYDIRKVFAKFY